MESAESNNTLSKSLRPTAPFNGAAALTGDRLAKDGKEALTGQGGYVDDQPGAPPGPGPTGFEDATGTLLTRGRKRELAMGRGFHSKGGTASTV